MKHTKCKICGKEHALGGCPEFQSTAATKDMEWILKKQSQVNVLRPAKKDKTIDERMDELWSAIIQKHNNRLAYQAQYQRDLRAATKLGISVKEFRAAKGKEE